MELDLAGMHQLAAGQGIDPETLDAALSEALRLAYLKTPHAAKHARVELDPRGVADAQLARRSPEEVLSTPRIS